MFSGEIKMRKTKIDDRFFESTRGKIVLLLRLSDRTVDGLSKELSVSDNAVRAHLLSLERDGLVFQNGVTKGFRKPHFSYSLSPAAEALFPKPFDSLFSETIGVLKKQLPVKKVEQILRQIGAEIAAPYQVSRKDKFKYPSRDRVKSINGHRRRGRCFTKKRPCRDQRKKLPAGRGRHPAQGSVQIG